MTTKIKQSQSADTNIDTVDPTVNDDETLRYGIGSKWLNDTTDTLFICTDATTGAAVWQISLPTSVPKWRKLTTLSYTDFSAAALTKDVVCYTLANKESVQGFVFKHSQSFTGGAIASYTLQAFVNTPKFVDTAITGFVPVQVAVSNTAAGISSFEGGTGCDNVPAFGGGTIYMQAVAVGANLDQASQGTVELWALLSQLE